MGTYIIMKQNKYLLSIFSLFLFLTTVLATPSDFDKIKKRIVTDLLKPKVDDSRIESL